MSVNVVLVGPAHPLRGGLASFDQRLAKAFNDQGDPCSIYSFSLQYPAFLFPGTTQYSSEPAPADLDIHTRINSINPLNWISVVEELRKKKPDVIVVRFWLPFMGAALGTILRRVRKNKHTRIVAITDNVIPHEKRPGDPQLTRYFLKSCDAFVTMSEKVMKDLKTFEPSKPAKQVLHPLYDNFGEPVPKFDARAKLGIDPHQRIVLFFGFIRKYKGLDLLFEAIKVLKEQYPQAEDESAGAIRFLIAGEFYENEAPYHEQIKSLGISNQLILRTQFIADSEVKYYLGAADVVIQPYRNATQSGVTPLAYHFEKPMIVTNVGSLPTLVPHEKVGLVCEPEPASIAAAILRFFELGETYFIPHLRIEKEKYSWKKLTDAIFEVANIGE
jgi:glycosyltransferase involved in cell wall biosynthesis